MDIRLNYALLVAGSKDAWRRPGDVYLAVKLLEEMSAELPADDQMQKQIEYERKRLFEASKEPPLLERHNS